MDTPLYSIDEAMLHVLEPSIESEMEDLDDSDQEFEPVVVPQRIEDTELVEKLQQDDIDQSALPPTNGSEEQNTSSSFSDFSDHVFRWRSMTAPLDSGSNIEQNFSLPPIDFDEITPLNYFEMFWKPDLNNHIAHQTNLYAMQEKCVAVSTSRGEIEQLIGMQMLMSVVKLPKYEMYWANETRYPPIADVMPKNRYKTLRRFLHVNDNSFK